MANKLDFKKLSARKPKATPISKPKPKKVYQEVELVPATEAKKVKAAPKPTAKKKVGRKSWKKEGVNYTRIAFDLPVENRQKLKQLLVGKFYNKYISQDEMINVAINDFIRKHS